MKIILMMSLFFVTSDYSMEQTANSVPIKPINVLFKTLYSLPREDENYFKTASTIIGNGKLDPFLSSKVNNLFDIIGRFDQSLSSNKHKEFREKIIDEFKIYVSKMISLKLLSQELQFTSSPEELIYNDAYRNFLSNIKTHCWNVYKDNLKKKLRFIAINGAALAVLNSETVATYFEYNTIVNIHNTTVYLRWIGNTIYGSLSFIESLFLLGNSLSYNNFRIQIFTLENETNKVTKNGDHDFDSLRIA